jgi:hypothetical protein
MPPKNLFDTRHRVRRDLLMPEDEKSLRALVRAFDSRDVPLTRELIHGLAVVVAAWPPAKPRS